MTAVARPTARMSVPDFLAWDSADFGRHELVDGEPRAMAPTTTRHGWLQNELGRRIGNHLRSNHTNCDVVANPGVIPQLMSAHNFRIPDLGVTCAGLSPGQATLTDPILLVEILSPSNQVKTWSNVWAYTSNPSLREILVLHGERISADLLRRTPTGQWPTEPESFTQGNLYLESINLQIPLAELYDRIV